jgi:hypothetical protein
MAKKAEFNLATVKKYIFWAVLPIGVIAPLVLTSVAVGTVSKAFNDRKTALENQKSEIEKISTDSAHPNEATIADINNCTEDLRGRVVKAWTTMEKDQKERNTWPGEELGEPFMAEIERKKFHDPISVPSRETYLNFIEKYLPQLEIYVERRRIQYFDEGQWRELDPTENVGSMAQSSADSGMGSGPGMGGGMSGGFGGTGFSDMSTTGTLEQILPKGPDGEEIFRYVGKVDWPSPETRTVTTSWERLPRSNEVWYAQEELWVYYALLFVVKESNLKATGPHNAVIKRIANLLIGQQASAALAAQSGNRIGKSAAGMDSMMSGGSDSMSSGAGGSDAGAGGLMGESGGMQVARSEEDVIKIKKNRRYVDDKGEPLAADAESPFGQFNRMPICLRLIVDQRKIPEILVNCANCPMPIDVLWVRFNPAAQKPFELSAYDASVGAGADGGDMGGGMSSGGMGGGSDMSSSGMGSGMSSSGGMGGTGTTGGETGGDQIKLDDVGGPYGSYAIPIEIYGCINIFNPVDTKSLKSPAEETAPPAGGSPAETSAE